MEFLKTLTLVAHVCAGLVVIGLVLIQHGKGADMGAAFGSGASGSLFGATGSANFLSRATAICAAVFFLTSLSLSYMATAARSKAPGSVVDAVTKKVETPSPAAPVAPDSKAGDVPK